MMKSKRFVRIAVALALVVLAVAGCAKVDWNSVKSTDIIANIGGHELKMSVLRLAAVQEYIAGNVAASSTGTNITDLDFDEALTIEISYMALAKAAEDAGKQITREKAEDVAYSSFVLGAKKDSGGSVAQFVSMVKSVLRVTDEQLLSDAAEERYFQLCADELLKELFAKYKGKLKGAELRKAIADDCHALTKDIEGSVLIPREKQAEYDFTHIADRAVATFRTSSEDD
jgi:hypothetical protein